MSLRASVKWIALALVGVAIAIGVAIAAANLTSQQIGIASESVSAGDALAPSLRTPEENADTGKQREHEKITPQEGPEPIVPGEVPPEEATPPGESAEPPAEESKPDDGGGKGGDD